MQSRTSAGDGQDAATMRENLFESLPPEEQARFLDVLKTSLESGMGNDAAWEEAWLAVQEAEAEDHGDEDPEFALEDEKE